MSKKWVFVTILVLIAFLASLVGGVQPAVLAANESGDLRKSTVPARNGVPYFLDEDGVGSFDSKAARDHGSESGAARDLSEDGDDWLGEVSGWTPESYCDTLWGQYFSLPGAVWHGRCDHAGLHKPDLMEFKYVNLDEHGAIRWIGTEVYIWNHQSNEMYKYVTDGCTEGAWHCTNLWGDIVHKAQKYRVHEWPQDQVCLAPPVAEPLPRLGPPEKGDPSPNPPPPRLRPPVALPSNTSSTVSGSVGVQSHDCYHEHTFIVNGKEHALPSRFLIERHDGRPFFPAERHTLKFMGIDGWIGGDRFPINPWQKEVLYLGRHDRVLSSWTESGYTLRDVGEEVGTIDLFLTEDGNFYYFDLKRVVELLGGWMYDSTESIDGKIHIGFPEIKGSWYGSCLDREYDGDKLKNCPIDRWIIGSTWEFYFEGPGHDPDALESIMKTQGLIWRWKLGPGKDPVKNAGLRSMVQDYNVIGLRYEQLNYDSYYGALQDFLLETALIGLDAAIQMYGSGYLGQLKSDPAKTVALSEEARTVAVEEQAALGMRSEQIRRHVLEEGLNLVEEGGRLKSLPVNILGEKTSEVGRIARVYPVGPVGNGGFPNQSRIGGLPAPRYFDVGGKRYVLMFEYVLEKGEGARDSVGRWLTAPGLPGVPGNLTLLEIKAGYDKYLDPKTGDFFADINTRALLKRMMESFRQDMLKADALGIDGFWVFTQQGVRDAFVSNLAVEYGDNFVRQYGHRMIVTTRQVVEPLESGDFPLQPNPIGPPAPPGPGPCGNTAPGTSPRKVPCGFTEPSNGG